VTFSKSRMGVVNWFTCETCDKRTYWAKSDAKNAKKQTPGGDKLGVYLCPTDHPTRYHIGHLGTYYSREEARAIAKGRV